MALLDEKHLEEIMGRISEDEPEKASPQLFVLVGKGKKLHEPSSFYHGYTKCGLGGELKEIEVVEPSPLQVCQNCQMRLD